MPSWTTSYEIIFSRHSLFFGVRIGGIFDKNTYNSIIKKLHEAGANILASGTKVEKLNDFAFRYNLVTRGKYINVDSSSKKPTLKNSILIKKRL